MMGWRGKGRDGPSQGLAQAGSLWSEICSCCKRSSMFLVYIRCPVPTQGEDRGSSSRIGLDAVGEAPARSQGLKSAGTFVTSVSQFLTQETEGQVQQSCSA